MLQTEDSRIRLMRAWVPDLKAGKYTLEAEQVLEAPVKKTAGSEKIEFYVNCPKFSLAQDEVYGRYPDMGSRGNYGSTMPHVVFESENLPWEREVEGQDEYYPWMALVCFSRDELPQIQQCAVGDLAKLKKQGVYAPDFVYEKTTGEAKEQICEYMDVGTELYGQVFPRQDEVPLLSHVRMADLHEKEDSLISLDGTFSSLVCNRFPVSSGGDGTENVLCAVSLEGYGTRLPGGRDFAGACKEYQAFRFVILYRWSIHSVTQEYPGFRRILEQMDSSAFSARGGEDALGIGEILKRGYLPLGHITRTGEQTVSFYRGPLTPYGVEDEETRECTSADGEIRYDPEMGMMDMSYSAAWQLGRMLALKNQTIAQSICRWRREAVKDMFLDGSRQLLAEKMGVMDKETTDNRPGGTSRQQLAETGVRDKRAMDNSLEESTRQQPTEKGKRDGKAAGNRVELDFLRMYGAKLAEQLVVRQRIAPLADPTGLLKVREQMPGLYAPDCVREELKKLGINDMAHSQRE